MRKHRLTFHDLFAQAIVPQLARLGAYGAQLDMNALHDRRQSTLVRIVGLKMVDDDAERDCSKSALRTQDISRLWFEKGS